MKMFSKFAITKKLPIFCQVQVALIIYHFLGGIFSTEISEAAQETANVREKCIVAVQKSRFCQGRDSLVYQPAKIDSICSKTPKETLSKLDEYEGSKLARVDSIQGDAKAAAKDKGFHNDRNFYQKSIALLEREREHIESYRAFLEKVKLDAVRSKITSKSCVGVGKIKAKKQQVALAQYHRAKQKVAFIRMSPGQRKPEQAKKIKEFEVALEGDKYQIDFARVPSGTCRANGASKLHAKNAQAMVGRIQQGSVITEEFRGKANECMDTVDATVANLKMRLQHIESMIAEYRSHASKFEADDKADFEEKNKIPVSNKQGQLPNIGSHKQGQLPNNATSKIENPRYGGDSAKSSDRGGVTRRNELGSDSGNKSNKDNQRSGPASLQQGQKYDPGLRSEDGVVALPPEKTANSKNLFNGGGDPQSSSGGVPSAAGDRTASPQSIAKYNTGKDFLRNYSSASRLTDQKRGFQDYKQIEPRVKPGLAIASKKREKRDYPDQSKEVSKNCEGEDCNSVAAPLKQNSVFEPINVAKGFFSSRPSISSYDNQVLARSSGAGLSSDISVLGNDASGNDLEGIGSNDLIRAKGSRVVVQQDSTNSLKDEQIENKDVIDEDMLKALAALDALEKHLDSYTEDLKADRTLKVDSKNQINRNQDEIVAESFNVKDLPLDDNLSSHDLDFSQMNPVSQQVKKSYVRKTSKICSEKLSALHCLHLRAGNAVIRNIVFQSNYFEARADLNIENYLTMRTKQKR